MHELGQEADDGRGLPLPPDVEGVDADERGATDPVGRFDRSAAQVEHPAALPTPPRATHRRWSFIALVALGGALGTAARESVSLALPAADVGSVGALLPTFLVNVTGAFALGLLLEALLRLGPDDGRRQSLRLLVGTGFLGGYTTYSALAVGADQTIAAGQPALGLLYATLSIMAGAAAAFAGVAAAGALHRWRQPRREAAT